MISPETANEVLQLTADVLEELNIRYWIDSGTLLGAYRDKAIIPYDHDIDVRIFNRPVRTTARERRFLVATQKLTSSWT